MMLAPELFRSRLREEGDATAGEETRAQGSPPRDARSAALHRIRKLDVDAKVVGIQLELVAFKHPPFSSASMVSGRVVVVVEGKLPVPVTL
jgi:hypothetical protein